MMHEGDKAILKAALQKASIDYQQQTPRPTIASGPSKQIVDKLAAAFEHCDTYKAVAGKVLFSGGSGPIIDAFGLASRLFSKGLHFADDIDGAVDWVIRLMTTQVTTGRFKAAFWGLRVDGEASLSPRSRLMPFDALTESYMKRRIVERAGRCYDGSQWMTQSYFDNHPRFTSRTCRASHISATTTRHSSR
jgi:hypothetical protein